MIRNLLISPAAEQDIAFGYRWYEDRSIGLGARFLEELEVAFGRILRDPFLYQETMPGLRRSVTKTFPYLVFYTTGMQSIHVLAVIHAAQDPKYVSERLGA